MCNWCCKKKNECLCSEYNKEKPPSALLWKKVMMNIMNRKINGNAEALIIKIINGVNYVMKLNIIVKLYFSKYHDEKDFLCLKSLPDDDPRRFLFWNSN
ncbi:27738_t:CDS:2, partial [Racocetra persica]